MTLLEDTTISTVVLVATWLFARATLARLEKRRLRGMAARLKRRHLAHWRYAPSDWQRYCELRRCQLWYGYLRPAARCAVPVLVLTAALAAVLEWRWELTPGLATAIIFATTLTIAAVIIGPTLREYVRLTRLRRLEYEVYVGADGVLEVWRQGDRVYAAEEHLYKAAGGIIRQVEAKDVNTGEIVFQVDQPGFAGVTHLEERFLVPDGRLPEARRLARRLTTLSGHGSPAG